MRNPPADPPVFAATIARACRDAYCPRLPAPVPRLCEHGDLPAPSELASQWPELQQQRDDQGRVRAIPRPDRTRGEMIV